MTASELQRNNSLKDIKHIISDIDGTLLNDNGELGSESKKLVKELMKLKSTNWMNAQFAESQ